MAFTVPTAQQVVNFAAARGQTVTLEQAQTAIDRYTVDATLEQFILDTVTRGAPETFLAWAQRVYLGG